PVDGGEDGLVASGLGRELVRPGSPRECGQTGSDGVRRDQPVAGPVAVDDPQRVAGEVRDPVALERPLRRTDRTRTGELPVDAAVRLQGDERVPARRGDVEAVRRPGRVEVVREQTFRTVMLDDPRACGRVDEDAPRGGERYEVVAAPH